MAGAAVAAFALAPALQAQGSGVAVSKPPVIGLSSGLTGFTPASADPKLAAVLARSGLGNSGRSNAFRFTPSTSDKSDRAVTVAVRARSSRGDTSDRLATANQAVSLTPIAYNLGVAVGWKRFAVSGDVAKIDMAGAGGSRETVDLGLSYTGKAFSGRVKAQKDRPLANMPRLIADDPSVSVDVGGSYSITRNLDVTAGVRYKSETDRLMPLNDDRRDSQAVYVGTAFRF